MKVKSYYHEFRDAPFIKCNAEAELLAAVINRFRATVISAIDRKLFKTKHSLFYNLKTDTYYIRETKLWKPDNQ